MTRKTRLHLLGFECPQVAIRVKKQLLNMDEGSILIVLTDDPLAPADLHLVCNDLGHSIVNEQIIDDGTQIEIRLGPELSVTAGWPPLD